MFQSGRQPGDSQRIDRSRLVSVRQFERLHVVFRAQSGSAGVQRLQIGDIDPLADIETAGAAWSK